MSIRSLTLSWFRGASNDVSLEPNGKSMVVYGENGSGKSSFVDALEYVLNDHRVGHLKNEYAGKRQEHALLNVNSPDGANARIKLVLEPDTTFAVAIDSNGHTHVESPDAGAVFSDWEYRRIVLRQDEVASFVNDTKGAKYSALLPLLGLEEYEQAAENLRQLAKAVESEGELSKKAGRIDQLRSGATRILGEISRKHIAKLLDDIWSLYKADTAPPNRLHARCSQLAEELKKQVNRLDNVNRRHAAVSAVGSQDLIPAIQAARTASAQVARVVENLVASRVAVLRESRDYLGELAPSDKDAVKCPTCGTTMAADRLRAHIETELSKLNTAEAALSRRAEAFRNLRERLNAFKKSLSTPTVSIWRQNLEAKPSQAAYVSLFDKVTHKHVHPKASPDLLDKLEEAANAIQSAAKASVRKAPPETKALVADRDRVEAINNALSAMRLEREVAKTQALVDLIRDLEAAARDEIRAQSEHVVASITEDIQTFWAILHPGEPIRDVKLYIPNDVEKAIDIGLSFYGVEQVSPRLTLSEGHRNSLGLCVFLAMARQGDTDGRPIVLDDVVVSFDRNHRGMIAELLSAQFADRQILVLTHDRDWYSDLVKHLPQKSWRFIQLLHWADPMTGIRTAERSGTFDDARSLVQSNPSKAGHEARRTMDLELAFLAEKLQVRMPYLRSARNDHRVAHDFLLRLKSEAPQRLRTKQNGEFVPIDDSDDVLDNAIKLLETWGNKGTHSENVVHHEASKLIDACEAALRIFSCKNPDCAEEVWRNTASNGSRVQCGCGETRWRL